MPITNSHRRPPSGGSRALLLGLALTGLVPVACKDDSLPPAAADPTEDNQKNNQHLIGGFAANDPRLDGIGAMVLISPYGYYDHLCGAAVLTPETVVTAKHCAQVIPLAGQFGFKVGYATGPNVQFPKHVVELAGYELAPGDQGGFVELGRDVAVLHLEHPLVGITPLVIGTFTDEDISKAFAAIGYGIQDNSGVYGTRRLGKQTLKGREGRTLEHLFGTFERFLEWFETGNVTAANLIRNYPASKTDVDGGGGTGGRGGGTDGGGAGGSGGGSGSGGGGRPDSGRPPLEEIARYYWNLFVLEKDYEVVTGGAPGDAQPCFGDSGSPLMKHQDGQFVTYGVVSGGIGSNDLICDLGTVYATFGPEVMAFIDTAKQWVDPCGDMDSKGVCDGNVAKRCTNVLEGRRRVVDFDCGLVGMECNMSARSGQVSCDQTEFGPPPPTRPTPPTTPPEIKSMVDRVFQAGK